jgi:hypothetical protein
MTITYSKYTRETSFAGASFGRSTDGTGGTSFLFFSGAANGLVRSQFHAFRHFNPPLILRF